MNLTDTDFVKRIIETETLRTQRDALLAALESAARTIAVLKTFCDVPLTVVRAAETEIEIDAAIAAVKA